MRKPSASNAKNEIVIPADFFLDDDLAAAFRLMEFTQENIFLTGRAGTGKSTLLNYFRKHTSKKHVVLAATGVAALNVGGSTIHSFFGFPLRRILPGDPEIVKWGNHHARLKIVKKMDTLVIDEVSMVRADLLDAVDQSLRLNLSNDLPFGGKQVIMIGDIFQLPPVNDAGRGDPEEESYPDPYFFSAHVYRSAQPRIVQLNRIYRQQEQEFIYLLNRIRTGIATADDFDTLNARCVKKNAQQDGVLAITLTSVNALADAINLRRLMAISDTSFSHKAIVEGEFHERNYPAPVVLTLKRGCQVMMTRNDVQGKWVNGSIGTVVNAGPVRITVRFADGVEHDVEPVTWENRLYTWDRQANNISFVVKGTFTQFPLRLAWAITIHKSQGLTFDRVIIDLGRGAFAHGQLYVALSRCRTLEGITLVSPVRAADMFVDEAVGYFAHRHRLQ